MLVSQKATSLKTFPEYLAFPNIYQVIILLITEAYNNVALYAIIQIQAT